MKNVLALVAVTAALVGITSTSKAGDACSKQPNTAAWLGCEVGQFQRNAGNAIQGGMKAAQNAGGRVVQSGQWAAGQVQQGLNGAVRGAQGTVKDLQSGYNSGVNGGKPRR